MFFPENEELNSVSINAISVTTNDLTEPLPEPNGDQAAQVTAATVSPPEQRDEEYLMLKEVACTSTQYLKKKIIRPGVIFGPFHEQSLTMIYAKAGQGKSWLAHSIGLYPTRLNYAELSLGSWRVEKPCGVLLVDGELPMGVIQPRVKLLATELGDENPEFPFTIITAEELQTTFGAQVNLTKKKWRSAITRFLKLRPEYGLVVFDNVSSLAPGINENTKQDWDPINQWLLLLRRHGKAVILIHHASKSGTDRGTSARQDNLDNVIFLERDKEETDKLAITLRFEKARYLEPCQTKPISFELVSGPNGGIVLKEIATKVAKGERLREVIKLLNAKQTQKQIGETLGLAQSRISQLRKEAIGEGYLDADGIITPEGLKLIED